ncbi:uncharacterized protein LOC118421488 isoform X1 [Branchiostoma floridae]|uniref:Uncharacterized protein LOC118421488 isoform X1 n=1 Tax=Branchiostoma floridae TaxID=7739 RepID=A0A9J7MX16_BRAFL|nr:uncharacterized protein LOC118421488 isoform X1 [Branchiostoma floridae]
MSELSSPRHCSTAVKEAKIPHGAKAKSACPSAQNKEGGELDITSPAARVMNTTEGKRGDTNGIVGIAPPLGEHEKYHVFFCYSSADGPCVEDMVQKLESDENGFKCCFHERDFPLGEDIFKNMARSIEESQKTVFVLSPDFVKSRWCEFEMQMAMGKNITEENKKVIPVMLRKCDLPYFLRHRTYLEEGSKYFLNRFIGALEDESGVQPDPFSAFTCNPNYSIGQAVCRADSMFTSSLGSCQFDDEIVPAELMSRGIKISRDDTAEVFDKLQKSLKMEYFTWFYTTQGQLTAFVLLTFIFYHNGDKSVAGDLSPLFSGLVGAVALCWMARFFLNKLMERTMAKVNAILVKYHILATVTDEYFGRNQPVVHFVYYERGSCLEELLVRGTQKSSTMENSIQGDSVDPVMPEASVDASSTDVQEKKSTRASRMQDLRAKAEDLLLKYSDLYVRRLVTKELPELRDESRGHTQQGTCLCQLVEMYEFSGFLDWVVIIVTGQSFSYWKTHPLISTFRVLFLILLINYFVRRLVYGRSFD